MCINNDSCQEDTLYLKIVKKIPESFKLIDCLENLIIQKLIMMPLPRQEEYLLFLGNDIVFDSDYPLRY